MPNIFHKLLRGIRQKDRGRASLVAAVSLCVLGLSGCLKHTRILERPQKPTVVLSASAQQLIQQVDGRYDAIHSLKATVLIRASVGGSQNGKVTDYTSIRGYILLRQPSMLRVLGLLPVVETRAFDMASNGDTFTLWIPHDNEAFVGSGAPSATPSPNPLMNLRPDVFFNAMLIPKIGAADLVYVTSDTLVVRDPHTHHLLEEPDYELGVLRRNGNSQQLLPERVIHISRTDLLPYQQDTYDDKGILVTRAFYTNYQTFDQIRFPAHIVIDRPIDGYKLDLTIEKLTLNSPITDDQFQLKIPPGTKIQHLP